MMEQVDGFGFGVYAKKDFEMTKDMVDHFADTMQFQAMEFDMAKMTTGMYRRVEEVASDD